jgi:hypothetical protein
MLKARTSVATIVAVPRACARTSPLAPTVATEVSLDVHCTGAAVVPAHVVSVAATRNVSPGCSVANDGDTRGPSSAQPTSNVGSVAALSVRPHDTVTTRPATAHAKNADKEVFIQYRLG